MTSMPSTGLPSPSRCPMNSAKTIRLMMSTMNFRVMPARKNATSVSAKVVLTKDRKMERMLTPSPCGLPKPGNAVRLTSKMSSTSGSIRTNTQCYLSEPMTTFESAGLTVGLKVTMSFDTLRTALCPLTGQTETTAATRNDTKTLSVYVRMSCVSSKN